MSYRQPTPLGNGDLTLSSTTRIPHGKGTRDITADVNLPGPRVDMVAGDDCQTTALNISLRSMAAKAVVRMPVRH